MSSSRNTFLNAVKLIINLYILLDLALYLIFDSSGSCTGHPETSHQYHGHVETVTDEEESVLILEHVHVVEHDAVRVQDGLTKIVQEQEKNIRLEMFHDMFHELDHLVVYHSESVESTDAQRGSGSGIRR